MYIAHNRRCFADEESTCLLDKIILTCTLVWKVSLNFSSFQRCTYLSVSLSKFLKHVSVYLFLSYFLLFYFLVTQDDVISRRLVVRIRLKNGFEIGLRFFWLSQTEIGLSPEDVRYRTILVSSHLNHTEIEQNQNHL